MTLLAIAVGAAVGAPLRYLIDQAIQARLNSRFPWGTLTVNVVGCFLLGLLTGLSLPDGPLHLLGTGFSGALTTYSTFGYETVRLLQQRARPVALLNVLANLTAGLAAACTALALTMIIR